ncbi:MAG: DUF2065 domain-containing protein [Gammaproteobacteria bacterium]|nr:DUF2065 domain-containing protein [Gammaproteobacteria bacterium]MBL6819501.1 DUF2065 domain-containing protein [Gammaproteobacteria bacterium]MBL6898870.1 DUF2065 domain-containing protein [Gammaproteobacteria bacterium]
MTSLESVALVFALILILEGIIPLFYPNTFKNALLSIADMDEKSLRMIGLTCIIFGLVLYYLAI